MRATIRPRPSTPPTVPPIIADVLLDWVLGLPIEVVEGEEEAEEDVETPWVFPTVDSGSCNCIALNRLSSSGVTTSR